MDNNDQQTGSLPSTTPLMINCKVFQTLRFSTADGKSKWVSKELGIFKDGLFYPKELDSKLFGLFTLPLTEGTSNPRGEPTKRLSTTSQRKKPVFLDLSSSASVPAWFQPLVEDEGPIKIPLTNLEEELALTLSSSEETSSQDTYDFWSEPMGFSSDALSGNQPNPAPFDYGLDLQDAESPESSFPPMQDTTTGFSPILPNGGMDTTENEQSLWTISQGSAKSPSGGYSISGTATLPWWSSKEEQDRFLHDPSWSPPTFAQGTGFLTRQTTRPFFDGYPNGTDGTPQIELSK